MEGIGDGSSLPIAADQIAVMADRINDFGDALRRQPMQLVPGEGTSARGQQRLGTRLGERTHPRSQPARENHALHRIVL